MIEAFIKGGKAFNDAIDGTQRRVDKATVAAIRSNQRLIKNAVRKNLTGPPRWNSRGSSEIYPTPVTVDGPKHAPRSGPPGLFTGVLRNGVGGVRRPKVMPNGDIVGGVGISHGPKARGVMKTNNFKLHLEATNPFFKPGVDSVQSQMGPTFDKAWSQAVDRIGGIV